MIIPSWCSSAAGETDTDLVVDVNVVRHTGSPVVVMVVVMVAVMVLLLVAVMVIVLGVMELSLLYCHVC